MDLPKALNAMSKDGLRVLAKSIGGLHPPSEKKNLIQYVITRIVVQLPPLTTHNKHATQAPPLEFLRVRAGELPPEVLPTPPPSSTAASSSQDVLSILLIMCKKDLKLYFNKYLK